MRGIKLDRGSLAFLVALCGLMAALVVPWMAVAADAGLPVAVRYANDQGSFAGAYIVTGFKVDDGLLFGVGRIVGVRTDTDGNVVGTLDRPLTQPVRLVNSYATCDSLHLELAPITLAPAWNVTAKPAVVEVARGELRGSNTLCTIAPRLLATPVSNSLSSQLNMMLAHLE